MSNYSTENHKYAYIWKKYRPAILKLMVDADNGPQEYPFSKHEFFNVNPKEKGGYTFTLQMFENKAIEITKTSALARDLLVILQQSPKCYELTSQNVYVFNMDKSFVFHVSKEDKPSEEEEESESNEGESDV